MASEAVLTGDMNLNNSTADCVTPSRTHEDRGNRQTSSPSSSGVSGEGDEEELDELQSSEEALQESLTKTRVTPPQERTTADNEQKHTGEWGCPSVSLPRPRSPPGPIGRCACLVKYFCLSNVICNYGHGFILYVYCKNAVLSQCGTRAR